MSLGIGPHDTDCPCARCAARRLQYAFKKGDHVRIRPTKPNGEPHPHAGKTGIVAEAWITRNALTVKVDPGIEPQGYIAVSRESAEKL